MVQIKNKKELKNIRSKLRSNMPAPEVILWQKIRGGALGTKFRRQFSYEDIILDFYSPTAKLAVEIDGDSHYLNQETIKKDQARDFKLKNFRITVLRFTNRDIMTNLDGVIEKIMSELDKKNPLFISPYFDYKTRGEKTRI